MPLIQIHLLKGKSAKYIQAISDGVHNAIGTAWGIERTARFQVIHRHAAAELQMDKTFWGMKSGNNRVVIVVGTVPRSLAQKKAFYRDLLRNLSKDPKIDKKDVMITLLEIQEANWYV